MAYKFKYLIFREKPFNRGETVAVVDVSIYNKKEIKVKWDQLVQKYSIDRFQSCLSERNEQMDSFEENIL